MREFCSQESQIHLILWKKESGQIWRLMWSKKLSLSSRITPRLFTVCQHRRVFRSVFSKNDGSLLKKNMTVQDLAVDWSSGEASHVIWSQSRCRKSNIKKQWGGLCGITVHEMKMPWLLWQTWSKNTYTYCIIIFTNIIEI